MSVGGPRRLLRVRSVGRLLGGGRAAATGRSRTSCSARGRLRLAAPGAGAPAHHPVLNAERVVVVVDPLAARGRAPPAQLDDRVDVGPELARQVEVDRRPSRARARGSGRGRRRTPRPARRGGRAPSRCGGRCRCRRRGTTARRRRGSVDASRCAATRRTLRVGEHRDVGARASRPRRGRRPAARRRVVDPGVLRQQRERAGHQHHPGRRGSLEPPDRPLRRPAAGDRPHHVDGLPGLDHLVHAVDPGARRARRRRSRRGCR